MTEHDARLDSGGYWARWERQQARLPGAWAATIAPLSRAAARQALRCATPDRGERQRLSGLLAVAPHSAAPARWLRGTGEYAGVAFHHPDHAEAAVIAARGFIGIYPQGMSADRAADRAKDPVVYAVDTGRRVERLILELIGQDADERELLTELVTAAEPSKRARGSALGRRMRSALRR